MAIRQSTGLRNFLNNYGGYHHAFTGGKLLLYSGSQPATADAAATGTLLNTISLGSGTWTAGVRAYASTELTGGGSGSVGTLVANGLEIMGSLTAFNGTLAQTAADIAAKINVYAGTQYGISAAVLTGAVITVYAPLGSGTAWNTKDITAGTLTTITVTDTDFAAGVAQAYGLTFGISTDGVMVKSGTWSGVGVADGTAGWFRLCGCLADAQALSTTAIRLDGNVSTSGANLNLASTAISIGATTTIDTFSITVPAA
jgi:hypothetical protein